MTSQCVYVALSGAAMAAVTTACSISQSDERAMQLA
jgi:hypothetical protein